MRKNGANRNIVIHIGMPKSASTSLQFNFFNRLPNINYSGIGAINKQSRESLKRVIFENEVDFNADEVKKGIVAGFNKHLPVVLSHENSLMPILREFIKKPQRREVIARRFKALYHDAKILLIIRNQLKIHQSMYVQKLKGERDSIPIKHITFGKWLEWNIGLNAQGAENVFRFAEYDAIINLYRSLFSEVKVVVFEEMVKDIRGFIEYELCPFIGVDAQVAMPFYIDKKKNTRRSKISIGAESSIRVTLNFFRDKLGNPQRVIPLKKRKYLMKKIHEFTHLIPGGKVNTSYSAEHKKYICEFYAEGNRKVSEMIGVDLGKYGYPV